MDLFKFIKEAHLNILHLYRILKILIKDYNLKVEIGWRN